jgi:hypothetical protein
MIPFDPLIGGEPEPYGVLHTTEIYQDSAGVFSPGTNLKDDIGRFGACITRVDSNTFYMFGGTSGTYDKATYRHDIDSGVWTELPQASVGRYGFPCGISNGKEQNENEKAAGVFSFHNTGERKQENIFSVTEAVIDLLLSKVEARVCWLRLKSVIFSLKR